MATRVVDKIVAESGLTREEAEALLEEFVSALRNEVYTTSEAIVPGIGSFRYVDGRLDFSPDKNLSGAVNVRFGSLEPIQIPDRRFDSIDDQRQTELSSEPEESTSDEPDFSEVQPDEPTEPEAPQSDGFQEDISDTEPSDPVVTPAGDSEEDSGEDDAEWRPPVWTDSSEIEDDEPIEPPAPFAPPTLSPVDEQPVFVRRDENEAADDDPGEAETEEPVSEFPSGDIPYVPGDHLSDEPTEPEAPQSDGFQEDISDTEPSDPVVTPAGDSEEDSGEDDAEWRPPVWTDSSEIEDDEPIEPPAPFAPPTLSPVDEQPVFVRRDENEAADDDPGEAETEEPVSEFPSGDIPYVPGDHLSDEDEYAPPPAGVIPPEGGRSRRRMSPAWFVSGAVVIILVVAGAYLLMSDRSVSDIPRIPDQQRRIEDDSASEALAVQAESDVQDEDVTDEPLPDQEIESPVEEYSPLYGDAIDTSVSRYTLIIASLPSRTSAEQVSDQWRERGIRSAVFSDSTPAGIRYRVGIGEFTTIASADSVRSRSEITPELPEGTWVLRYPATPAN